VQVVFIVKRLGRNGMWNAVSLIDENGSFRGEAKFESEEEAKDYLAVYLKRMEERLGGPVEGRAQVKVFDDSPRVEPPMPPKPQKPLKVKKPRKTRPIKKRKKTKPKR
jgi:hypothetical protein